MTVGNNAVKHTAKTALKPNMTKAIFAACIVIFSYFACLYTFSSLGMVIGDIASFILFAVAAIVLLLPLGLGLLRFVWRMLFSAEDNPVSVFYYLSEKRLYFKALKFVLNIFFKSALIAVTVLIPAILVWLISQSFIYELLDIPIPIWTANLENIFIFLRTISVAVIAAILLRYYSVPILFVADDDIETSEAIYMAKTISRKTYIDFIFLLFSFLGWILLSVLVIPLVFTLPYMLTAFAVHVRYAIADYNMFIEKQNTNNYEVFGNFGNEF